MFSKDVFNQNCAYVVEFYMNEYEENNFDMKFIMNRLHFKIEDMMWSE